MRLRELLWSVASMEYLLRPWLSDLHGASGGAAGSCAYLPGRLLAVICPSDTQPWCTASATTAAVRTRRTESAMKSRPDGIDRGPGLNERDLGESRCLGNGRSARPS